MPKSRAEPVTKHIANRVRVCRSLRGVSQESLGRSIGVTFQQIQKYENGKNSISAERLYQIAYLLNQPIGSFFEGLQPQGSPLSGIATDTPPAELALSAEQLSLCLHFNTIADPHIRKQILDLTKALSDVEGLGRRQLAKKIKRTRARTASGKPVVARP